MFVQRQSGSQCRMHTINNLVGAAVVDRSKFVEIRDEFGRLFNCLDTVKMELTVFNLYGEHVPLYAIRKLYNFPSFTLHPKTRDETLKLLGLRFEDVETPLAIAWDRGHIWAMRRLTGVWYNFDSRSGKPVRSDLPMHLPIAFVYAKAEHAARLIHALRKSKTTLPAHLFFVLLNMVCCFEHKPYRSIAAVYTKSPRQFQSIRQTLLARI